VSSENGNGSAKWRLTKEKILMFSGIALIWYAAISVLTFNVSIVGAGQILLAGLACCGVSIARWGDKQ
jgi:hypothetical protein